MNMSKFELNIIDRFNKILQKDSLALSVVDDKSRKTGYRIRLLDIRKILSTPSFIFHWYDIQDIFYNNDSTYTTFFQLTDIYDIDNMPELNYLIGCHSLDEVVIKLDLLGI